jgi:TRAP transporter TAXI family solute receptor
MAAGLEANGDTDAMRALAREVRRHARVDIIVEGTAGYAENLRLLGERRADLALAPADLVADAVNGQGVFRDAVIPARTISTLADAALHLVVRRDSPLNGLSALRGHRVSTGPRGSATELTTLRVLQRAHLDPERLMVRESLDLLDAIVALREQRIDAFFWLGVVPVLALHDATDGHPAVPLGVKTISTASVVPLLQDRFGTSMYSVVETKGEVYGWAEPWAAVGVPLLLVGRADLPDGIAYDLARALLSDANSLGKSPVFTGVSAERARRPAPAAQHPGAARYYREMAR